MGPKAIKQQGRLSDQYLERESLFNSFLRTLDELLTSLLRQVKVPVQSIEPRLKSLSSVRDKALNSPGKYDSLDRMTDVCGVRVVVWFEDDVAAASTVIEQEFEVDWENSGDKSEQLMPNKFGYRSRHLIVKLNPDRVKLAEYRIYKNIKAEIQIRSVLQHVWAEVEHDMGYKGELSIPAPAVRRFARLAALLEIGDEEIKGTRHYLAEYKKQLGPRIESEPECVNIDRLSLQVLWSSNYLVSSLDTELSRVCASRLRDEPSRNRVTKMVVALDQAGVGTVADLLRNLKSRGSAMVGLVNEWHAQFGVGRFQGLSRGASIWFLAIGLAAKRKQKTAFAKLAQHLELDLSQQETSWLVQQAKARLVVRHSLRGGLE